VLFNECLAHFLRNRYQARSDGIFAPYRVEVEVSDDLDEGRFGEESIRDVVTLEEDEDTAKSTSVDNKQSMEESQELQAGVDNEVEPAPSDYGLYKCKACGRMVMGFEKEKHLREVHGGINLGYKKIC
jgi:hypothetical protein